MRELFYDYSKRVRACYKQKKLAGTLSLRFNQPTPAKMRDECVDVCRTRYLDSDEKCLWNFFGEDLDSQNMERSQKAYLKAIERCDIDKFRPLINLMAKDTANPHDRFIELLAWLIDVQPRPYVEGRIVNPKDPCGSEPAKPETGGYRPTNQKRSFIKKMWEAISGKPYLKHKKNALLAVVVFLVTAGGFSWLLGNKEVGQQKCMYWAGYEYKLISCDQKLGDTLVIAWDSVLLHKLKKIARPDTITSKDIGKVWYKRTKGRVECFTADGPYPPDPKYRLRPITNTIIDKYIRQGLVSN